MDNRKHNRLYRRFTQAAGPGGGRGGGPRALTVHTRRAVGDAEWAFRAPQSGETDAQIDPPNVQYSHGVLLTGGPCSSLARRRDRRGDGRVAWSSWRACCRHRSRARSFGVQRTFPCPNGAPEGCPVVMAQAMTTTVAVTMVAGTMYLSRRVTRFRIRCGRASSGACEIVGRLRGRPTFRRVTAGRQAVCGSLELV